MKTIKVTLNSIQENVYTPGKDYTFSVEADVIKEIIKQNPELLKDITPTSAHKRQYFVPKVGGEFYVITSDGKVLKHVRSNEYDLKEQMIWLIGNAFKTEEDGYVELNRRQALVRIWNNYDDKYSWDIDWDDNEIKYDICCNYNEKTISRVSCTVGNKYSTELPYFKSAEDRNQFVSENEKDLLTVFNIKTK